MSATEILIHDRDDLRPGDVLRVWDEGAPDQWAEGPICCTFTGCLMVGGTTVYWANGTWEDDRFDLTAHPARRTVPPVDPAQVEMLTRMLGAEGLLSHRPGFIARRLLETGRIEVML